MISTIFQANFCFRHKEFAADCETRKALGGSGGMVPRKNLENLHAGNGCFSAFRIIF